MDPTSPSGARIVEVAMASRALRDELNAGAIDEDERRELAGLIGDWLLGGSGQVEQRLTSHRDLLGANLWVLKDPTIGDRLAHAMVESALTNGSVGEVSPAERQHSLVELLRLWILGLPTEVRVFLFDAYGL